MKLLNKKALVCAANFGLCFFMFTEGAYAANSQQLNQDAAGLGDAQAGGAASGLDASTEFYNPAALIRIPEQQVVLGGNLFMPTYDFEANALSSDSLDKNGNGGVFNQQLFLHYAAPISPQWAFGFGISSPFSMHSSWNNTSSESPNNTDTRFGTYDVSTDLAYAITPAFSIGAGFDFVKVVLSDADYSTADYSTSLSGSQWDKAWHGGLLYQFSPDLRFGLSYHSKVDYEVSGYADVSDSNGAILQSTNDFVMASTLPAYTTASVYYRLNSNWAFEESIYYTQWTQADSLSYENLPSNGAILPNASQEYAFKNTWRNAVGLHYTLSPEMVLRTGLGYETSPYNEVNTAYLAAPTGESYDASLGLDYQLSKTLAFSLAWTHIFYLNQSVNVVNLSDGSVTSGEFSGSNDILGAEIRWNML